MCARFTAITLALALVSLPGCGERKDAGEPEASRAAKPDAKPEPKPKAAPASVDADGRIEIEVDAGGYTPAEISAPPKTKITLAFKRTSEQGCGEEVQIKGTDIKQQLPVGEVVEIVVETPESGAIEFACGMDMYQGKVVVEG